MKDSNVTPTEKFVQLMDYLYTTSMKMRKTYYQKLRNEIEITDEEFDDINKSILSSLDIIG